MSIFKKVRNLDVEPMCWAAGLLFLALVDPEAGRHFSWCVFRLAGLESCPGCGLGTSIAYLFDGDFARSFQVHPLGGVAVFILGSRIVRLLRRQAGR